MKREVPRISIVVPVFNEQALLPVLHARLRAALHGEWRDTEVVYVDDGSSDGTAQVLAALRATETNVAVLRFSRNFGKEAAMAAGLDAARGDCVVMIDADLQHPPERIPDMLRAWRDGADVVNMRRTTRADETWAKRTGARLFYRVLNALSEVPIPADVGDFRLLSRRAAEVMRRLEERNRFTKGLAAWIGFRQVTLAYECGERAGGASKWPMRHLWRFAVEGITAFSAVPLRLASHLGLWSALAAFGMAAWFTVKTLVFGEAVQGFPTLAVAIFGLGGLQLLAIGVLGEYLGRIAVEAKRRPLYVVESFEPARALAPAPEASLDVH